MYTRQLARQVYVLLYVMAAVRLCLYFIEAAEARNAGHVFSYLARRGSLDDFHVYIGYGLAAACLIRGSSHVHAVPRRAIVPSLRESSVFTLILLPESCDGSSRESSIITTAKRLSGFRDTNARGQRFCVLAATVWPLPANAQVPGYHVTKTVPLGLPDRWDYVTYDPASHRVYVSHGDQLTVVDGHSGAIVGQVEGFPGGTHGIAIVTASSRGYTDDGRAGEAGSFDLETLKVQQHHQGRSRTPMRLCSTPRAVTCSSSTAIPEPSVSSTRRRTALLRRSRPAESWNSPLQMARASCM